MCSTTMTDACRSRGRSATTRLIASTPPAEAPMAMTSCLAIRVASHVPAGAWRFICNNPIRMGICGSLVLAHGLAAAALGEWDLAPLVVVPLAAAALLYLGGIVRLWRRAGVGHGISGW